MSQNRFCFPVGPRLVWLRQAQAAAPDSWAGAAAPNNGVDISVISAATVVVIVPLLIELLIFQCTLVQTALAAGLKWGLHGPSDIRFGHVTGPS